MWVRFTCPACDQTHQFDMPETTIHMTCSRTAKPIVVRLTPGGDVKAQIFDESQQTTPDSPSDK